VRKFIIIFVLIFTLYLFFAPLIFSQAAEVVYVEGTADIKRSSGRLVFADFGELLANGDSVITGTDGRVELEKENESLIRVSPDTVFVFREKEEGGEKKSVFQTSVGSVFLRFTKLTGNEPQITTGTSVAGIRGTELTVFAGVDGSSLFIVDSGKVEVSSEGETVQLLPGEGVEVEAGRVPGEKFEAKHGKIDYSEWNRGKLDAFLQDPADAAQRISRQLSRFIEEIRTIVPLREENIARLEEERKKLAKIKEEKSLDEAEAYYLENLLPIEEKMFPLNVNLRYYALSALSLKRYVLGRMYLIMKSRYITRPQAPEFTEFLKAYRSMAADFEDHVVPYLAILDI
jgi:hypothetical protein